MEQTADLVKTTLRLESVLNMVDLSAPCRTYGKGKKLPAAQAAGADPYK